MITQLAQTPLIPAPSIAYYAISPLLVVLGAALVGVLVEAFVPATARRTTQNVVTAAGLIAALVLVAKLAGRQQLVASGAVAVDGPALFLQGSVLVLALTSLLLLAERSVDSTGGAIVADAAVPPGSRDAIGLTASQGTQTEAYPLMLFAVSGMMLFSSANNLIVSFIALELLSLPLYLLAGLARHRRLLSQEAAVKYFLLGAFSSAFFLYGLALVYGYANTLDLGGIATASRLVSSNDALLYSGMGLLAVGLLFKIGAVPFHAWTPDVYQGAPTPITAFMAAGTKVAAFGALLRIFYVSFGSLRSDWRPLMWGIAILTMVIGAVVAVVQEDVKRLLAYSSIAHAGFILTGLVAVNNSGLSGSMFYLVVYGFTIIGSFAVVTLVRDGDGEATHLSRWRGLGKTSPLLAGAFSIFLFALAGIPLTSGFMGKYAVFTAAIAGHAIGLVVVGVVTSAVTAFFYAKIVVLMFFNDPPADAPVVAVPSAWTAGAVGVGLAVTVVMGILPSPLLELANRAATFAA